MRSSTAACLLALLGILVQPAQGRAQDLVERVRAATGAKAKLAPKPPAKSKPKASPKPKPKAKPKATVRKPSKPAKKPSAPAKPPPAAEPEPAQSSSAAPSESPPASSSEVTEKAADKSEKAAPAPAASSEIPPSSATTSSASSAAARTSPTSAQLGSAAPVTEPALVPDPGASGAEPAPAPDPGASGEPEAPAPSAAPESSDAPDLQLALFVDAYAGWQSSGNGTMSTLSNHRAFSGQGSTLRAENGFGLAFLGLDVSYATPTVGVTANLRFGEGVPIYRLQPTGESDAVFGVEPLTQAYLTWHPWSALALDLGVFNTPFGIEVLESWRNLNYTRGALYYYAQPGWHSGLRVDWTASESWELIGFIANGSNIVSETQQDDGMNQTPTLGAQLNWSPSEALWLAAGGLFTTDSYRNDDAGFDALADVMVSLELGRARLLLNADYVLTRNGAPDGSDRHFFGVSAGAGYAFSELFGAALRGEWLLDDASYDQSGSERWRLFTVTLTAELEPIAAAPHLILRWDNRWEESNQQVFGQAAHGTSSPDDDSYADVWFQSVLGVVVTTVP